MADLRGGREPPDDRLRADTPLRQAQMVMLGLLRTFDALCEKHNLTYWLTDGTLLGAARHAGFIPWDDDLDVIMPREDYDRFFALPDSEFPFYVYHDKRASFQRLRDRFSKRIDDGADADKDFNSIYIDVFPAKKFPLGRKILCRVRMLIPPYKPPAVYKDLPLKKKVRRRAARFLYYFFKFSGIRFIISGLCALGPKKYWSYDLEITWHYHWPDRWIFPLARLPFEGSDFPVPGNWRAVLKYQFGDWTRPPPESERNHHHNQRILATVPCTHPEALNWEDYYHE